MCFVLYSSVCLIILRPATLSFFFFNDTATTEIYTLSLHDALPISVDRLWKRSRRLQHRQQANTRARRTGRGHEGRTIKVRDRKSTRLNSSHLVISYAVFCLKKKKKNGTDFTYVSETFTTHSTLTRV